MTAVLLAAVSTAFACRRAEGPIVDTTGVLAAGQRASITDYLEWVASERGVDYRVVVVDKAEIDLERAALARYERLGIGERTEGRGMLLLVNTRMEEARVEVGYALEHRVRDVEASSMIRQFLAPYFASGQVAAGIEASVERLVDLLEPGRETGDAVPEILGTGGAGATAALEGIDRLTPETRARLDEILVPQAGPQDCIELEMALMERGIYYRQAPMYDEEWRRANRPDLPPRRLREIAREWRGPFEVARTTDHAITYFTGDRARRFGPHFLRRTEAGWIIDASAAARYIVYDYSNRAWYAVDGDYPYLELIRSVYEMQPGTLSDRRPAWAVIADAGS